MSMSKTKDDANQLPRIQSQKRVHTAQDRNMSTRQALSNRPQSNNLKRTLSSANTCKAYKYETTSAMYSKKIEELQKHNLALDNEMRAIQKQIDECRQSAMNSKRKQQFMLAEDSKSRMSEAANGKVHRKNINMNDSKTVGNEIRMAENKIAMLRKKIDEQIEKNQRTRKEIDVSRKQIFTLKALNDNLMTTLSKTNDQFKQVSELSKLLDEQIGEKNSAMIKIKKENIHKKAQIIKQYSEILRELDKELESDKLTHNSSGGDFYVTQFGNNGEANKKSLKFSQISPKKRRSGAPVAHQISFIKQKLSSYEHQFEYLKQQTGTRNSEQITTKFINEYEQNFNYYKYLNELHKSLEEAQSEQQQLIKKRDQILDQMTGSGASQVKNEEIAEKQRSLEMVKSEKVRIKLEIQEYDSIYKDIKEAITEFCAKVEMKSNVIRQQMSEGNISKFLQAIQSRVSELNQSGWEQGRKEEKQKTNMELDLDDALENVRKQNGQQVKSDKMMTREDFIRARQAFIKKRKDCNNSKKSFKK